MQPPKSSLPIILYNKKACILNINKKITIFQIWLFFLFDIIFNIASALAIIAILNKMNNEDVSKTEFKIEIDK